MFNKIKMLSMTACAVFLLQSCHSDDDALFDLSTPVQITRVDSTVLANMRTVPAVPVLGGDVTQADVDAAQEAADKANGINSLFTLAAIVSGRASFQDLSGAAPGTEPCKVKLSKLAYDTIGGAGEATTSTGVVMVPYSDDANSFCNEPRPVVLYAHGTNADRDYDLSKIISDPSNAANQEGMIMLAMYASEGYVVVAPNYAGYADSALSYHPYVDEVQQSTEMINALDNVRTHASTIGANLSSKLFVTGLSQGGYVAMATHKALQARGETVTASLSASGPYVLSKFLDTVMAGYVNGGATTFAPMYLTALDRANNIYGDNPSEVYAVAGSDNIFPNPGANDEGYPVNALFSENSQPPLPADAYPLGYAGQVAPFDTNHVLTDAFRSDYLAATPGSIGNKVKELAKAGDLNNWSPTAPLVMCGAERDPVVYFSANTETMAEYWMTNPYVSKLDLDATPAGSSALLQGAWQSAGIDVPDVHSVTGVYCAGAGLATFNSLSATSVAAR